MKNEREEPQELRVTILPEPDDIGPSVEDLVRQYRELEAKRGKSQELCIQCAGPADRFGELYAYSDSGFGLVWLHKPCRAFWVRTRRPHPSIEHLFRCVDGAVVH